ncbi:uncharacterized protein LOC115411934 isoform X1 [Sphaeramia orbicularis]|uniref:uncharacterized protein LOC115411934 isoform X1 n=1 Tax=Sphaeramia orbicularis TaxID=375764 RepID=UPI00117E6A59|nr:uncharacterized protein LOC115411934 isoform X1 [Sphaeramia orbicularis]
MENLSWYFWTSSLMCCIFWISSAEERNTLSTVVGSTVTLRCRNESLDTLTQVIWKRNGKALFSVEMQSPVYQFPEASSLKINMSVSKNELYPLITERVQKEHEGNYTCETTLPSEIYRAKWELIIITENEDAKNLWTVVPVVICICNLLVFDISWTILQLYKRLTGNNTESPTAETQTEVIYEPCLDMDDILQNAHDWPLISVCRESTSWKTGYEDNDSGFLHL